MIHAETTKEGIESVEIKGSAAELMAELTSAMHVLRKKLEEEYEKRMVRKMLEIAFNLAFDDEKMNETTVPDEGFDGGNQ